MIVTADDFGASFAINAAVEQAHRHGILACASIMANGQAFDDAIARAKTMPHLSLGLHIAVTRSPSVFNSQHANLDRLRHVHNLGGHNGQLSDDLGASGWRFFFSLLARRALRREIGAQFDRFAERWPTFDHVSVHNHMHIHPTILSMIMSQAKRYNVRHIRLPHEPFWPSWRVRRRHFWRHLGRSFLLWPWIKLISWRLRWNGFRHNRYTFGIIDSLNMRQNTILRLLRNMPTGIHEIHFHPMSAKGETAVLTSPLISQQIQLHGFKPSAYAQALA